MGLAMSGMRKYSDFQNGFMSEDVWTVEEFWGISWRWMFGNHLGRGKRREEICGEWVIMRGQELEGEKE